MVPSNGRASATETMGLGKAFDAGQAATMTELKACFPRIHELLFDSSNYDPNFTLTTTFSAALLEAHLL